MVLFLKSCKVFTVFKSILKKIIIGSNILNVDRSYNVNFALKLITSFIVKSKIDNLLCTNFKIAFQLLVASLFI